MSETRESRYNFLSAILATWDSACVRARVCVHMHAHALPKFKQLRNMLPCSGEMR